MSSAAQFKVIYKSKKSLFLQKSELYCFLYISDGILRVSLSLCRCSVGGSKATLVVASRDISEGEEITDSYSMLFQVKTMLTKH